MLNMKKLLPLILSMVTLAGFLSLQPLFADRDDEANRCYLDAYNLYKLGKLDQSLEMLRKVVEINPDHAEAHFGMGSIYFRQNMFDDAVKEFTKVTRIKPEYVEAYQRLWLAYKKLGMNDKAEEELQKYKRLIEERMQNMVGGSPQVVKPVTPPKREEPEERPEPEESEPSETKVETSQPAETRQSESSGLDNRVPESRIPEREAENDRPAVERPVAPVPEEAPPPSSGRPSVLETRKTDVLETTKQLKKRYTEPPEPSEETKYEPATESGYKSPYIKVDKKDPRYKHLFKPFKKLGLGFFKNPFRKTDEKWKGTYLGKLAKGILYYVVSIQIWLCIVAILGIYFVKKKGL